MEFSYDKSSEGKGPRAFTTTTKEGEELLYIRGKNGYEGVTISNNIILEISEEVFNKALPSANRVFYEGDSITITF